MSEEKHFENDPERTLITLEQLSQTIEVMTSVVNRLRQHLSEQLHAQMEEQQAKQDKPESKEAETATAEPKEQEMANSELSVPQETAEEIQQAANPAKKKESFVVEIRQQNSDPTRKNGKTLH